MKKLHFSKSDIKYHFRENKTTYFMLFLCLFIGVVVGIVLVFTSTHFVGLLTSGNKSLYAFINGTADYFGLFWKKFLSFSVPVVLICVVSLNYFSGYMIDLKSGQKQNKWSSSFLHALG